MAKTPKKPAAAKPAKANTATPVGAATRKVKKAVEVEKLEAGEQGIYRAKAGDIDLALHRCLSHLGDLSPSEVNVAIKLLKPYYLKHGIRAGSSGLKFG